MLRILILSLILLITGCGVENQNTETSSKSEKVAKDSTCDTFNTQIIDLGGTVIINESCYKNGKAINTTSTTVSKGNPKDSNLQSSSDFKIHIELGTSKETGLEPVEMDMSHF